MIDELVKQKVVSLWYTIRNRHITGEHQLEVVDVNGDKHRITFIQDGEYFEMTSERIEATRLESN